MIIFSSKDYYFSKLGDMTQNELFSHLKEGSAEILSTEISDP